MSQAEKRHFQVTGIMFLCSKANENAMYSEETLCFVFKNRLLFVFGCFFSQLFVPCVLP